MTMTTVPPLSLSTAKQRYPHLFQQYTFLSEREGDVMDDSDDDMADLMGTIGGGDQAQTIDPSTGLRTIIMGTNFSAPLDDGKGCPMTVESDANKFAMFLWKMLSASESGSIGGDACRQFDILNSALDDILALSSNATKFEHLLGWTAAAANHQLEALLHRGDPDRNRLLFKSVGDQWKKVFEANENASFVNEELRSFANWQCGYFQQLLKHAKKEYGGHAKYAFNFVKKPRVKKAAAPSAPAAASAVATVALSPAASTSTIIVTKQSKDSKLGIGINQEGGRAKVTCIAPDSLFVGTALKVGMTVERINGVTVATGSEAVTLLKLIEGLIVIAVSAAPAAADDGVAPAVSASSNNANTNQMENAGTAPTNTELLKGLLTGAQFEETMPWEEDDFMPKTKAGKQKSPNVIRSELQKYIDQCKADGSRTQTNIIEEMGVNNNTFRRYMDPKTYKDQWSAVQNGTYWAAARLLAKVKFESDLAKKTAKKSGAAKRKAATGEDNAAKKAKSGNNENDPAASSVASASVPSKSVKEEAVDLINRINAVAGVSDNEVYDTCPQLVAKIKTFLNRDGMTKANLLRAFGNINSNSLQRFLSGKKQDQCASVTYKAAYVFFEKLRILEGKPKTSARKKNEIEQIGGFSLVKYRGSYIFAR